MKKLLLLVALAFLFLGENKLHAQTFLDKNTEWMTDKRESIYPQLTTRISYYFKGDSLINGKLYYQLYEADFQGKRLRGFLREDAGKYYLIRYKYFVDDKEEVLYYDFNLKEGDTFVSPLNVEGFPESVTVKKVSTTTLLNGEERKVIQFNNFTWVEGMGNIADFLLPVIPSDETNIGHYTICYKEKGEIRYRNAERCEQLSNCCYSWGTSSISETIVSDNNIQIEKADNCFIVTFTDMNDRTKTIQLIDLSGKVVKEVRTTDESYNLDMQDYENGVYLLQAQCGQAKSVTKVMKTERF